MRTFFMYENQPIKFWREGTQDDVLKSEKKEEENKNIPLCDER